MEELVNRVANSSLVLLDFDEYISPLKSEVLDLKDGLFQGMILREREFRDYIREYDWSRYADMAVCVTCSVDVIIPSWAYMLVVTRLQPVAKLLVLGTELDLEKRQIDLAILKMLQTHDLRDARVIVKGCGSIRSRDYAYFELTQQLVPQVASIMYGEPCSTVPVYKRPTIK